MPLTQFHKAIFVGNDWYEVYFKSKSQGGSYSQNKDKNANISKEEEIQVTYVNIQLFSSIFV